MRWQHLETESGGVEGHAPACGPVRDDVSVSVTRARKGIGIAREQVVGIKPGPLTFTDSLGR